MTKELLQKLLSDTAYIVSDDVNPVNKSEILEYRDILIKSLTGNSYSMLNTTFETAPEPVWSEGESA